jgi:ABC-type lipoprotein export system ATPase subunit
VAVHGIDCEIHAGARVAITGPSGSGKSTLLHLFSGIDAPTTGEISWPALGPRDALRPGRVALVFQGPSLLPPLDVLENVALPLVLGGASERDAQAEALEALCRLDLEALTGRLPDELSGGQAQRVAVARALAGRPGLILADEPSGQLDHAHADAVLRALLDTAHDLGAALVVTTHDPLITGRLAVEWRMHDGRLFADWNGTVHPESWCSA